MVLELNARPGLAIQIANRAGLQARLQCVEQCYGDLKTVEDRVGFAQKRFIAFNQS
jgi:hypothetical protein